MTFRLLSIWIAVSAAVVVAFFCKLTAHWMANLVTQELHGKPLPNISEWFYAPNALIYWFPIPLLLWASVYTLRFRQETEHAAFLRTLSFGSALIFLVVFIFAIALPFMPIYPAMMQEP